MVKLLHRERHTSTLTEIPTTIEIDATLPGQADDSSDTDPTPPAGHAILSPSAPHGRDPDHLYRFDGRARRRQAAVVVVAALLTGAAGVAVGSRVRSPADAAADRAAPVASRITTPVTRQALESTLTLSGDIQFTDPAAIVLAGSVGVAVDEAQVVTRVPAAGDAVAEGDVPFEVSGRPIFFLEGSLPMYRRLTIGMEGTDVAELEASLDRMGHPPGPLDGVFDQATADALGAMYDQAGYAIEGPTAEQAEAVRFADASVTSAEQSVRDADAALVAAKQGLPESQRLQLRQAVDAATAAVPVAKSQADNEIAAAQRDIDDAVAVRDAALVERDTAKAARVAADRPGAIDPITGEPYTAIRRSEIAAQVTSSEAALASAERTVAAAQSAKPVITANADAAVKAATDLLAVVKAQLAEGLTPADTAAAQQSAAAATASLDQARLALADATAAAGPRVAPGEIVFLPALPSTITSVDVALGSPATSQLGTASTSDITVRAAVSRADSGVVTVGAKVSIELRDVDVAVPGTVVSIGQPAVVASTADNNEQPVAADEAGRLEVVVAPDEPNALADYVYYGARLRIDVASTGGDVLVVPVSALTVGADGNSRVVVEESPITADSEGSTRTVAVSVGLSTNGLAEVTALTPGTLDAGDPVVVGIE